MIISQAVLPGEYGEYTSNTSMNSLHSESNSGSKEFYIDNDL